MIWRTRVLSLLFVAVAFVAPARADDAAVEAQLAQAREHYVKGTKAFELGLYEEAIAEYMIAYKSKDDPALLFNLGQANRLAGHLPEATRFYRLYLRKDPAAPNRAEIEARIAELERLSASRPRALPTPTLVAAPALERPAMASPLGARQPLYRRWWLWTAVGATVAIGVGLGVGLALAPSGPPSVKVTSGTYPF